MTVTFTIPDELGLPPGVASPRRSRAAVAGGRRRAGRGRAARRRPALRAALLRFQRHRRQQARCGETTIQILHPTNYIQLVFFMFADLHIPSG